jgi:HAD superfamily hydrolase (TIGR01509 family)
MYQAVYFDAFNTLFGTRWAKESQARRLPLQQIIKMLIHDLDAGLQEAYGRARSETPIKASRPTRLFANVADWTGMANSGPLAVIRRNEDSAHRWFKVYADAITTLTTLRDGCRLGLITNAWPYLESLLQLLGLWPYFESVTISAQVGLKKPNPAIYELALRSLGMSAEQAIFVDDIPQNVLAAERVGLKGLWLVRSARHDVAPAFRHLQQITSLWEIVPIAQGWDPAIPMQPA